LWSRDGRYGLVFNGEIYNFKELRGALEADGVVFRTTSDTEVLLESILHSGIDAVLPRLEGMFAFALYDAIEGTLSLARDRFGIKPLYVVDGDDAFIFASEVRAMRPWLRLQPDMLSISSYLHGFGGPTSGRSMYRDVSIVPPGSVVVVTPGRRGCYRRFWRVQDFWQPEEVVRLGRSSPRQLVDEVEQRLFESVRMQLAADVPVGVLCSGGLDSSLIAAMASRIHNNLSIFHADIVGPMTEVDAATAVANHLKLHLETVAVHDQDSIDAIPEVIQHYGQPFTYHPNSVAFLMVSRLVHGHRVKAILSGEGADECYVGYPWLIFDIRESVLGASASLRSAYRLLRRGFSGQRGGSRDALSANEPCHVARALHNRFEVDIDAEEVREDLQRRTGRAPSNHDLVTLDQLGYHLRTLLHRNDSLGMAASIEARFPFLDSTLVGLAANLPYNAKVRLSPTFESDHYFLRDKWVLRQVAARYLPRSLAQRKKRGFPVQAHQRIRIKPDFFNNGVVADAFALSQRELGFLLQHANQELRQKLLHLEVWARVCLDGVPPADMSARLQSCASLS
jgi:asparagine synthase (glutamine-hydrolysing)